MSVIITPNMCSSCKHSLRAEGTKDIYCRRYPPVTYMMATPNGIAQATAFAKTEPAWTCGEYERGVLVPSDGVLP